MSNKISLICPLCGDYGGLTYKQDTQLGSGWQIVASYYVMDCCGSFLMNGKNARVTSQEDLIRTLKEGTWRVAVPHNK